MIAKTTAGVIRKAHSDSPLFSSSPSKGLTWAMVTWIGNGTTGTGPGISFLGERERQGYALAVVSAFAWGTEGRRFESCHLDRESSRAYPWRMGRTTKLVNSQGVNE